MSVIFPKPLPPLQKEDIPDQSGLTILEKTALRNTWRIIRRHQRTHAWNIFLDFYTENEYILNKFRMHGRKINLHSLHSHSEAILRIYDLLITEGLENYSMFHSLLTEVAASHTSMMHDANEIVTKQVLACQEYFESILKNINSPTNSAALQKLTDIILSFLT